MSSGAVTMNDRKSWPLIVAASLGLCAPTMAQSLARTEGGYVIHAQDFDLEAVVALIEENRVSDGAHLEEVINSDDSGINNIDIDWDGTIDRVDVHEVRDGRTIVFELVASPSSDPQAEGTPIASITFNEVPGGREVQIVASFPETVEEHEEYVFASEARHPIYSDHFEEEVGFYDWAFQPYRPPFIISNSFNNTTDVQQPRPVAPQPTITRTRDAFRRTSQILSIPKVPKQKFFDAGTHLTLRKAPLRPSPKLRRAPMALAMARSAQASFKPPQRRLQTPQTDIKPRGRVIYIRPRPLDKPTRTTRTRRPKKARGLGARNQTKKKTTHRTVTRIVTTQRVVTTHNPAPALQGARVVRNRRRGASPVVVIQGNRGAPSSASQARRSTQSGGKATRARATVSGGRRGAVRGKATGKAPSRGGTVIRRSGAFRARGVRF